MAVCVGCRGRFVARAGRPASCSPGDGPESIPLPTSTEHHEHDLDDHDHARPRRRDDDVPPSIRGDDPADHRRRPAHHRRHHRDVAYGQGWVSGEDHGCTLSTRSSRSPAPGPRTSVPAPRARTSTATSPGAPTQLAEIAAEDFEVAARRGRRPRSSVHRRLERPAQRCRRRRADRMVRRRRLGAPHHRRRDLHLRPLDRVAGEQRGIIDFLGSAQPPPTTAAAVGGTIPGDAPGADLVDGRPCVEAWHGARTLADRAHPRPDFGSNGWAIGADRVEGGTGSLLLANPTSRGKASCVSTRCN